MIEHLTAVLKQNQIESIIDQTISLKMEQNPWLSDILEELNGKNHAPEEEQDQAPMIAAQFKIQKLRKASYKNCYLIKGELNCRHMATCVNSLEPMLENLKLELRIALIQPHLHENSSQSEEEVEIEIDNEAYQLYFFSPGMKFELAEALREQIFLNENPFPKKKVFDCLTLEW
jgi:hypothetical protein